MTTERKTPPMRNLRTLVPPETFASLESEALLNGVTLAAWTRNVLIKHTTTVTQSTVHSEEWRACVAWLISRGLTVDRLKAEMNFTSKSEVMGWAKAKGWESPA